MQRSQPSGQITRRDSSGTIRRNQGPGPERPKEQRTTRPKVHRYHYLAHLAAIIASGPAARTSRAATEDEQRVARHSLRIAARIINQSRGWRVVDGVWVNPREPFTGE
jgi:hypothetical protein